MKKYIKIFLIIIFIFLINILNVSAEENVELKSVELKEKSPYVEINEETTFSGSVINTNINFYGQGDYVVYILTLKNNDNNDYMIEDILDDNSNDYLKFEYIYDGLLEANKEKNIQLKITYVSALPYDSVLTPENKISLDTSINISIKLSDEIQTINPNTIDNIHFYLIIEVVGVITLLIIFIKLKKKNLFLLLALAIILIPKVTNAKIELNINFTFNNKMEIKVNFLKYGYMGRVANNFKKIEFVKEGSFPSTAIDVSQNQDGTIMEWVDNETLYIGSKYTIFLPSDASGFFSNNNLTGINFNNRIDTTFVTNMSGMFSNDLLLTELDVSNFRTGNVTNMAGMFYNCNKIENYDFSKWNTSNVTNFTAMFAFNNSIKELDLSNYDTSNSNSISGMFVSCTNLEKLNLDNWDLSNLSSNSNFSEIIKNNTSLKEISMKYWKLPYSFTDFLSRAAGGYNDPIEKIDVTGWDLSNAVYINGLFADSKSLKTIVGLNTWDTTNVINFSYLFYNCPMLEKIDLSSFDFSGIQNERYLSNIVFKASNLKEFIGPKKINSLFHIDLPVIMTNKDNDIKYILTEGDNVIQEKYVFYNEITLIDQFFSNKVSNLVSSTDDIKRIVRSYDEPSDDIKNNSINNIADPSSVCEIYAWFDNGTLYYYADSEKIFIGKNGILFNNLKYVEYIDVSTLDSTFATKFDNAFQNVGYNAQSLEIVGLENFNLSNVTSLQYMFSSTGYNSNYINIGDISNWDTSNVTQMNSIFNNFGYNTPTVEIDLSGWDVSKVTKMEYLFYNFGGRSTEVTINVNNWHLKSLLSTSTYIFHNSGENANSFILNAEGWIIDNTTSINYLLQNIAHNTKNIYLNLKNWIISDATSAHYTLAQILGGNESFIIDVTGWQMPKLTDYSEMFYYTGVNAKDFTIIGIDGWDVSKAEDMSGMFYTTGRESNTYTLDLSDWDVSNVINFNNMFAYSSYKASEITIGNLSNWKINKDANLEGMFRYFGCFSTGLFDFGTLNIKETTNLQSLFGGSSSAKGTINLYNNSTNYSFMFDETSTKTGSEIIVNYTAEVTNIDNIINTKSSNSNVIKGELIEE